MALLDIADLNISHYQSYAHLEHGRFYTGLPVFYAPVGASGSGKGSYTVGPSVVWEVESGQNNKPGILEFNGHGLKFLENALDQKEQHIASLGGRMMGVRPIATAESDNALKLKERNEQATLLDISTSLTDGLSILLRYWAVWQDVDETTAQDIICDINKDFLFDNIGAREFRAIHAMYKDGVLPVEVLYEYMRRSDVIPDWMKIEEFKKLLENVNSFPGQPDAEARLIHGYPNKQSQINDQSKNRELDIEEDAQALAEKAQEDDAEAALEAAQNPAPVVRPAPGAAGGA